MDKSVLLLSFALPSKLYLDYDYIVSGNVDYNYLRSYNQLQAITITTDYDYHNPGSS